MKITDVIAEMIMDMFDDGRSAVQIQRNDLAQKVGCVPSQINYVITSRFTPEQGYSVESRRGGGGYIMISRVDAAKGAIIMHLINNVGYNIDEKTMRAHIYNLSHQGAIDSNAAKMMDAVASDKCYGDISQENKNQIRSTLFKQMLAAWITQ